MGTLCPECGCSVIFLGHITSPCGDCEGLYKCSRCGLRTVDWRLKEEDEL